MQRSGFAERSALLAIGVAALAFLGFGALAAEMIEGETGAFDRYLLLAFRNPHDLSDPLGPPWVEEVMRDITALGSVTVLTLITLTIVGFLFLTHKRRVGWTIMVSVCGGWLVSNLLKWGFARPRPDLVPHGTEVYTQSFPSGHAMLSAVVYLTLGALLARSQAERRVKVYLLTISAILTVIVGLSRIYLGVHWPTDVLAGWAVGAGWAFLCLLVMLQLQRRGNVEPEQASNPV
jgi:undecaprenyl-diphosphatase